MSSLVASFFQLVEQFIIQKEVTFCNTFVESYLDLTNEVFFDIQVWHCLCKFEKALGEELILSRYAFYRIK